MSDTTQNTQRPEKMFTVKEAAEHLGIQKWKLYRALKNGLVPYHTLLNSRKLVRLSEVEAAINQNLALNAQEGGAQ